MKANLILLIFLSINIFGQKSILISSGQMSKSKIVKINSIDFDLVLKNRDTIYLATTDSRFIIKEGLNVGKKISELPSEIKQNLTKEIGWGYFYNLPSGWSIAFCEGKSCTENYPTENSKIKWIFKRKSN
ncbi:hypothetical protein [Epilithonimonas lactis]|nr:hypothetical protein [Epilithonimonas lactis]SEQ93932.1 hypothetical protein SAMN04488097_3449 [Epilithonimonas lactis]